MSKNRLRGPSEITDGEYCSPSPSQLLEVHFKDFATRGAGIDRIGEGEKTI